MIINMLKKIFVSSLVLLGLVLVFTGCSEETETTVTITMSIEPTYMHRETIINVSPASQNIDVTSSTDQQITYSATANEPWIRLNTYDGGQVVDVLTPESFIISIASRTLDAGFYIDTVWVTAAMVVNSPYAIPVTLLVGDSLEFTPSEINFEAITFRGNPESQTINVESTSGEEFDFSMTSKETWLLLPDPTGTVPNDIAVGINSTGLTPGYYYDTITIDAPLAVNSPEYVPCSLSVSSWEKNDYEHSGITTLNSVFFIDDLHGWVVGDVNSTPRTGFIIATDDGGDNWVNQEFDRVGIISDMIFFDQNTGYICGEYGLIRKTTDGGDNWVINNPIDSSDLLSICFTDYNVGWVCGDSGTILHTSDAGETWENQMSNVSYDLCAVHFVNSDSGWVVGNAETILFTSDGGENWVSQTSPISTGFKDIFFIDNSEGWIVGLVSTILHTTNSGITWDVLRTGQEDIEYQSISFCVTGQGWIVGNAGTILYSADGITWDEQFSETDNILKGIYMITNNKGWVVGQEGMLLYTEVGGH